MARRDFIGTSKEVLYGHALGESPSIRQAAGTANVSVTGVTASFDLAAGEGSSVSPGDVLSFISENDAAKAYAFYVLSVSTDTVTAINGHRGAPQIADSSTDLDGGVFEQSPLAIEHYIHEGVDTIFDRFLWPQAFKINQRKIASADVDQAFGQHDLDGAVEKVLYVLQLNGGAYDELDFNLVKNPHGDVATGHLLELDLLNGNDVLVTTREKYAEGDEATENGLVQLVAYGAAAISIGAGLPETAMEPSNKDNPQSGDLRRQIARDLWGNFVTMREAFGDSVDAQPKFRVKH